MAVNVLAGIFRGWSVELDVRGWVSDGEIEEGGGGGGGGSREEDSLLEGG
ncbi:predicted protein [Sclerotinia sclerotiorum 1980 UF-70]|uniref:Uncharacterized protein n=1 Tax=Sclerotinia sclerotiorum (strain ATCC 18683 / 1980 / Ss-1) TaxID=665079 RepID=A7F307_SCLS1|nr:predicted protein [Sclerotinia sclerotiorum 1980 UF-70]EDN96099.1 predicted protein [Sclerotinia sclerotiorum 1980 UF-70]